MIKKKLTQEVADELLTRIDRMGKIMENIINEHKKYLNNIVIKWRNAHDKTTVLTELWNFGCYFTNDNDIAWDEVRDPNENYDDIIKALAYISFNTGKNTNDFNDNFN